ncbi:Exportin-T [Ascodesmis nigricans]|uniref:Exportin-T n=1 Tax=Ascodesmis nigricans TaxID=341454 RepID=A0A4S2N073_9PEZI|nr:Exportin-T [Ascodesmis nigricans]
MDTQLEQAITIASTPGAASPDISQQALNYVQSVRESDDGWQAALQLFSRSPRASETVRLVSLDILNTAVERRKATQPDDAIQYIKQALVEYIQSSYSPGATTDEGGFMQNKVSQIVTNVFTITYMDSWGSFFDEVMALGKSVPNGPWDNLIGVAFFLKISGSVHDEIADTLLPRMPSEGQHNIRLKDSIRGRDVTKLVAAWQEIMEQWKGKNDQVVQLCLQVVAKWVSWIDISVVVNETMMRLLFESMSIGGNVRSAALTALTEIVGKKMKGPEKLQLISFLNVPDIISQIAQTPSLQDQNLMEYDNDLAELVSKLVNTVLTDVVTILVKNEVDQSGHEQAESLLRTLLPMLLRFLSDQYDDVSAAVFPATSDLLAYFRKEKKAMGSLGHQHSTMLLPILNAIVKKMRYDSEATWGDEDEQTDEAEFEELRKKLKVLQDSIAAIDESLYRQCISDIVERTFQCVADGNGGVDWREIDLALYELLTFGELIGKAGNMFAKGKASGPNAETLINMLGKLMACNVANYSHPAIRLKSMEIFVRYPSFFEVHTSLIPQALDSFNKCIHDDHPRVRTRSWYLFYRFVKHLRPHMGQVSEMVIRATDDLRVIRAELPPDDNNDDMSSDAGKSEDATFESQLYLFEVAGCLASTPPLASEVQTSLVKSILEPVFSDIEAHLGLAESGDQRAILQIRYDIMALGTIAKGFSDTGAATKPTPTTFPGLIDEFMKATEAVLVGLERLNKNAGLREASRFAFTRLVGTLADKILPFVPRWIAGLMAKSSSKAEIAMFLKALEQIVHSFKNVVYDILNGLLTPLLQGVFASLGEPTTGTDDEVELADLRKEFLSFILVIINNDLGQVLVSEENRDNFDTVIKGIEHYVREERDPATQKIAVNVLTKLSFVFGPSTPQGNKKAAQGLCGVNWPQERPVPGFESLMTERFAMLCWEVPYMKGFNPKDAQGRGVLGEIGALQKMLYLKLGENYLSILKGQILPAIGLQAGADDFCRALQGMEAKDFKAYLQNFVSNVLGR